MPLVGDVLSQQDAPEPEEAVSSAVELIPQIDTSIEIKPGARIAVVSKATKGEFWEHIKKGMKNAVKDINAAYGFSKTDQIKMTFEGAEKEDDIEKQVNILDAVIAGPFPGPGGPVPAAAAPSGDGVYPVQRRQRGRGRPVGP